MTRSPAIVTRRLIQLLCAFMLLAQHAALAHVAAHVRMHAMHEQSLEHNDDSAPASELARLCDFDAAFGQVLSGGPATRHVVFPPGESARIALHYRRTHTAANALTPRSRGPPALL